MTRAPVSIIAGPTASGKTSYAIACAQEQNGIIINADSVQLYDSLPILSARPTEEEQAQAPHRLYAVLRPEEQCSAARWRTLALAEIYRALDEDRHPILTGGTGFYIKALTEGLADIPHVPKQVRAAAAARQQELSHPGFHQELARKDPEMAARLHPNDTQRLIRAWEVLEATGKSLSWWQARPLQGAPDDLVFDITIINPPRALLHERCDRRFDQMMAGGVMEEVEALSTLIDKGDIPAEAPATNALGFHALRACLKGETDLQTAIDQAKAATRQYAKRQQTWFRHQIPAPDSCARVARVTII